MSKRIFTKEQIKLLEENPYVERCSEKSITYSKSFKRKAIKEYMEGLSSNEIFKKADFNLDIIGRNTPKRRLHSWRNTFEKGGAEALSVETRGKGGGGGRPRIRWDDDKEKIKYLEAQVAYLKAENDFLAKLRKKRLN